MNKESRLLSGLIMLMLTALIICLQPESINVNADNQFYVDPVDLTNQSIVSIDEVFGQYMATVDENIYYSMSSVNSSTLISIYGEYDTPMFNMAKRVINPCMAFATTWGEAGSSYKGISLTTVMDFNPNTYIDEIDWIKLSTNMEQIDSAWYCAHAKTNYNTNTQGKAYHMPVALLQVPRDGDRSLSDMTGLGVGPYQITSSDWNTWYLDGRVNPIGGYRWSLAKVGTGWIKCGINPISDLTVYACLSLGHQGGDLIGMDFGKKLINKINSLDVQNAFNYVGMQMYIDAKEKASKQPISLSDINTAQYLPIVENLSGVNFSDYTGGYGSTNKGDYVALHCLRYVFYKYYFTGGLNNYNDESDNLADNSINYIKVSKQIANTFRNEYGDYSYSQLSGNVPTVINGILIDTPYRDCSSYVSAMMRVLYSDISHMNSYTLNDNLMNWNKINPKRFGQLKPGDILVIDGHTAMVVKKKDNIVYVGDCGETPKVILTAKYGYSTTYTYDTLISSWREAEVSVFRAP